MISIKRCLCFVVCVGLLATAANAGSVTLYDNLGAAASGADQIDNTVFGPLSDSFSTGGSVTLLTDVKVSLVVQGNPTGSITITLNSDSSTSPGAVLTAIGTLNDTSIPLSPTVFDFPVSSFSLAANTRYWIQIGSTDGSSAFWVWSSDVSGPGVMNEFYANQAGVLGNGDGTDPSIGPYQMQVTGSVSNVIPEPSSAMLLGAGIGGIVVLSRYRKRPAA